MKGFQTEAAFIDSGFSLCEISSQSLLPCALCWEDSRSHPITLEPILALLPHCVWLKGNSSSPLNSANSDSFASTTIFWFVFVQHLGPL